MRIPIGIARKLRAFLEKLEGLMPSETYERDQYLKALSGKSTRATKAKSKRRATKKAAAKSKAMTRAEVRAACMERAGGCCEACGANWVLQFDHQFGRANAESVDTCRILCAQCHEAKTANRPHAAFWWENFIAHAEKHGYTAAAEKARSRLFFARARSFLAEAAR